MTDYYDGTPGQLALETAFLKGRTPEFSVGGLRMGVVIDRKFKDDDGNASQSFTEYSVRDLMTGETYERIRGLQREAGMDSGDETVLHPASTNLPGVGGAFNRASRAVDTDGDLVLMGFVEGNRKQGIVLGVVPHGQTKYGATKEDGERRFSIHHGTSIERCADGSCQVKRGETTLTLSPDETIEVKHKSGAVMKFQDSGEVSVQAPKVSIDGGTEVDVTSALVKITSTGDILVSSNDMVDILCNGIKLTALDVVEFQAAARVILQSQMVYLGDTNATEPAILGNQLSVILGNLISAIKGLQVDIVSGLVTPASQTALDLVGSLVDSMKSDHVRLV